jgi:hypothetical protein
VSALARKTLELWERGASSGQWQPNTYANKYLRFVLEEHSLATPLLPIFPLTIGKLSHFVVFCNQSGINGGYNVISNYVNQIVKVGAARHGCDDPRKASEHAAKQWAEFLNEFAKENPEAGPGKKTKLRLQAAMYMAMALDMDLGLRTDLRDATQYALKFFGAWRAGHTSTVNRSKNKHHLVRWEHVVFLPSREHAERVFIMLRCTKTRKMGASKPFWTAFERLGTQADVRFCPVQLMQRWFVESYRGNPHQPVFTGSAAPTLALTRTEFTDNLRARLLRALPRLDVDPAMLDLSNFSSISFRKGGLSALGRSGVGVNRLAEHADHASIESTRAYTGDTIEERARNTRDMARSQGIGRGLTREESMEMRDAREGLMAELRARRPRAADREQGGRRRAAGWA